MLLQTNQDLFFNRKLIKKKFDEIVIQQEAQILPMFLVSLETSNLSKLIKEYQREIPDNEKEEKSKDKERRDSKNKIENNEDKDHDSKIKKEDKGDDDSKTKKKENDEDKDHDSKIKKKKKMKIKEMIR